VKSLGESDAAVEWIEVGVRKLQAIADKDGFDAIQALASEHGVRVNTVAMDEVRRRCARLELLAVYQQAEHFFRLFRKTHPRSVEFRRDSDEDVLSATLDSFGVKASQVGQLEHDVFQYYRIARNLMMHDPEGDQRKTHKRTQEALRKSLEGSAYAKLDAPNLVDNLCFDDFILFSRALKQLAANLCEATSPTDTELVKVALSDDGLSSKLRFLGGNPGRQANAVASYLRERYSIPSTRAEAVTQLVLDMTR
jgi:hypothetical protein